jgi:hypothetical protein
MYQPLFDGVVPNTTTRYIGIPVGDETLTGIQIAKKNAGAATFTLEMSEFPADKAPVTTAGTYEWKDSGEVIADPANGTSTVVHLGNIGTGRARLKVVGGAGDSLIEVRARRKLR